MPGVQAGDGTNAFMWDSVRVLERTGQCLRPKRNDGQRGGPVPCAQRVVVGIEVPGTGLGEKYCLLFGVFSASDYSHMPHEKLCPSIH